MRRAGELLQECHPFLRSLGVPFGNNNEAVTFGATVDSAPVSPKGEVICPRFQDCVRMIPSAASALLADDWGGRPYVQLK